MAAPTPIETLRQIGHGFAFSWEGHWTGTGEFSGTAIVDVSADFSDYTTKIVVEEIYIISTTGIEIELEFDATSDETLAILPEGATGPIYRDFSSWPDGGKIKTGAGGTGDIQLTTSGAASGDRVWIEILGRVY
jgi:hypothetical protein